MTPHLNSLKTIQMRGHNIVYRNMLWPLIWTISYCQTCLKGSSQRAHKNWLLKTSDPLIQWPIKTGLTVVSMRNKKEIIIKYSLLSWVMEQQLSFRHWVTKGENMSSSDKSDFTPLLFAFVYKLLLILFCRKIWNAFFFFQGGVAANL